MFDKEVPYIMVELDASFTPLDNEGHLKSYTRGLACTV